jgi:YD repeat-containing protein
MQRLAWILSLAYIAAAQTYTYDASGRLASVAYPGGGGVRYQYDDSDNITAIVPLNLPPAPAGLQLTRGADGSVRLSWQAVTGATSYVVMRRAADSDTWQELATVTALTYVDASAGASAVYFYRIAANSSAGRSAYSVEVSTSPEGLADPRSSHRISLTSGGSQAVSTAGLASATSGGYARVSLDSGDSPYGIAVFRLTQNGVVVMEAGVPASPPTRATRIFVDRRDGVIAPAGQFSGQVRIDTGIGMVNPNDAPARITLTLRNPAGQTVANGSGTLGAGAHVAYLVGDFKSLAPDFNLPADFPTATRFGSMDVESDQPVSVMALRLLVNQRGDLLFSSTPVADLSVPPSTGPLYFAHVPEGGGFTTAIFLTSTSANTQTGTIEFFNDAGEPFRVRPAGAAAGTSFRYSIAPRGSYVLETDGSLAEVNSGWARLTPDSGQTAPSGSGSFRFSQGEMVVTESGIATAAPTTLARVYLDTRGGRDTGLALANPGDSSAPVTLRAFQTDGRTPAGSASGSVVLPPRGHLARVAGGFVAGLPPDFIGVMEASSATPFVALTVRSLFNSRSELLFTTFPVADMTRPAPAPVIFPHIADGGGFQTELILIQPSGPASMTVRYFDDNGQPLNAAQAP